MALVKSLQDGCQYCRVLTSRGADSNPFPGIEEGVGDDGVVDLGFENGCKTGLAELLMVLRADDERSTDAADGTWCRWHASLLKAVKKVEKYNANVC